MTNLDLSFLTINCCTHYLISFSSYFVAPAGIEKLSTDSEQAVEYVKLSIEERDLESLREVIEELIKAGYKQYIISSVQAIEKANIKFELSAYHQY